MPEPKRLRLGWLQQNILTLLWNREMYGLEIQRSLKFKGEKVGPGQLYPALKKLEKMKAIAAREDAGMRANRKFYNMTDEGKEILLGDLKRDFNIIEVIALEKLAFAFDMVKKIVKVEPGYIVVDLSNPLMEKARVDLAPLTAPTGRYFILAANEVHALMLKERVELGKLSESITILKRQNNSIPLPSKSVDIVFVFFTIKEDGTDWMLKEMRRVLKHGGKGVIVDMLALKGHIYEEILPELMANHSRTGIDFESLNPLLDKNKLSVFHRTEERGVIFLVVQPKVLD